MFLREQAPTSNSNTSVSCIGQTLTASKAGTTEGGLRVAYSDVDGIDVSSIDVNDAYFVSKSNSTRTYPVNIVTTTTLDDGKLVIVKYAVSGLAFTDYADFGSLVIKSGQIKDAKGKSYSGKTISPIVLK